jgi:hypothetical protein
LTEKNNCERELYRDKGSKENPDPSDSGTAKRSRNQAPNSEQEKLIGLVSPTLVAATAHACNTCTPSPNELKDEKIKLKGAHHAGCVHRE